MSDYIFKDGELYHYGVLGMRWGVRRGNAAKAYGKASKKLTKIENKVNKLEQKARKRFATAERAQYGWGLRDPKKAKWKAGRARYKLDKKMKKAVKWINKMDSVFKNTDQKLTAQQRNLGEKYVKTLLNRSDFTQFI